MAEKRDRQYFLRLAKNWAKSFEEKHTNDSDNQFREWTEK